MTVTDSLRIKRNLCGDMRSRIILFEAAARELKKLGAVPVPSAERMEKELAALTDQKDQLMAEYRSARARPRSTRPSGRTWTPFSPFRRSRSSRGGMSLNSAAERITIYLHFKSRRYHHEEE